MDISTVRLRPHDRPDFLRPGLKGDEMNEKFNSFSVDEEVVLSKDNILLLLEDNRRLRQENSRLRAKRSLLAHGLSKLLDIVVVEVSPCPGVYIKCLRLRRCKIKYAPLAERRKFIRKGWLRFVLGKAKLAAE